MTIERGELTAGFGGREDDMYAVLLRANPDLVTSLLSKLPVGVAWLDHNLIVREFNPCLQLLLNTAPEDVLGRHCSEVLAPRTCQAGGQQKRLCSHCLASMRQGEVLSFVDWSGTESAIETTLIPVRDAQDLMSGVIVLMRDITEIQRAGNLLRENEDKYRSVVDNIGIGVAVISPEMRILSLNRQMRQWFPLVDASLQPVCYRSFNNPPRQDICTYCPTCKTLRDGQVHEAVTETPNGTEMRNYRIISSPIHNEAGQITAAIEMVEDCTERKRDEESLARYRNHLEEMVAERTRELQRMNHELSNEIQERKRAEEALARSSEKIKLFAYSISHDLKSPAVAIEGLCRLLDKRYRHLFDDRGQSYCEQIIRTASQLVELTGKINTYVSASNTSPLFEEVDLQEILRDLKAEFSCQLKERRIAWIEPEHAPGLMADRLDLLRILRNLVDNSLKYGGERLSEISFGYHVEGDRHVLTVSDNGAGLLSEADDKIFDLFHRQSGARQTEGSGLGLAIVRELADQHGGEVKAIRRPQGGVSFQVSLAADLANRKPLAP
jgi:PAS domain S-box-containing protein